MNKEVNEVFLSTEDYPQAHKVLGVVNATAHLMLPRDAIDTFESLDQLFSEVQQKLRERAAEKES